MTPDKKTAKGLSPLAMESLSIFIMKKIPNIYESREHGTHVPITSFKNHQCFANFFIYFSLFHLFLFLLLFFSSFFKLEYFQANPKSHFAMNISIIGMKRLLCGPAFLFL